MLEDKKGAKTVSHHTPAQQDIGRGTITSLSGRPDHKTNIGRRRLARRQQPRRAVKAQRHPVGWGRRTSRPLTGTYLIRAGARSALVTAARA